MKTSVGRAPFNSLRGIEFFPKSVTEGKGGGKPHMAQAGIKAPQLLPQALNQAPDLLRQKLGL